MKYNNCHKIDKYGINKLKQYVAGIGGKTTAYVLSTDKDNHIAEKT